MLALIIFALRCLCEEQTFAQEASLLAPYVDNNGKSVNWNIFENYLVKVHGNDTFIQLGYSASGTSGAMMASHPIGSEKFSIDLNIEIDEGDVKRDGNDGMAIWMSSESVFNKGSCFGRSCDFKGLLIAIKASGDSYIGVKAGDISIDPHSAGTSFDRVLHGDFSFNNPFVLRIVQSNYETSVYIGKSHDDFSLIHSYKTSIVGKDYYLGVSASTGQSSNTFRLLGIESYHLKNVKGRSVKEEAQHGGKLIWFLFFIVVGVTGYYLYSIQIKKKK